MDALFERLSTAKINKRELESLIADYMPFIKKTVNETGNLGMDYDDRFSVALLAFMNSVIRYEPEKGNFSAFAAVCIRNRLIDESRKHSNYSKKVTLLFPNVEESISTYNQEQEQENLTSEIDSLSTSLEKYGISFKELPVICPKHKRTRNQCIEFGRFVAGNKNMLGTLVRTKRLPKSELAKEFNVSEKTIEKHRKYIVTIVVVITGDYLHIKAFLPQYSIPVASSYIEKGVCK